MKLLSLLLTFILFFSISSLQAQNKRGKKGNKGNAVVDSTITIANTPENSKEEKHKNPKVTNQMLLEQIVALQGILVDCDSLPDVSPYMLRSEHTATVKELNALRKKLQANEKQFTDAKNKLNVELSAERSKVTSLTRERDEYSRKYLNEEKAKERKQNEIDDAKNALVKERKANQKITDDLIVAFLKQETADLAMVQQMIVLDKKLNSSKHISDLTNFNDIQELIIQGKAILNKALNTAEITKYKSDIQAKSALRTKYTKPFGLISKIENQIEDYIETTCSIQRTVGKILGSSLNTEQKKAKMKSKIKSDELEDIKSHFPYLYKEIEHAKKTLQWRISFQCD